MRATAEWADPVPVLISEYARAKSVRAVAGPRAGPLTTNSE